MNTQSSRITAYAILFIFMALPGTAPILYSQVVLKNYVKSYKKNPRFSARTQYNPNFKEKNGLVFQTSDAQTKYIPIPFERFYATRQQFLSIIEPLKDVTTNTQTFSSYKFQSVLVTMHSTKTLKQPKSVCLPAQDLNIKGYKPQGVQGGTIYRVDDTTIYNFVIASYDDKITASPNRQVTVLYNVDSVKLFYNTTCASGLSRMVKVHTEIFPGWGLSSFNVYQRYDNKIDKKQFHNKIRGISKISGFVRLYEFLYMLYERYNMATWELFDTNVDSTQPGDYGGMVVSITNPEQSIGFEFANDIVIRDGNLEHLTYTKVCVQGPAKVYRSGYYNIFKLSQQLKSPVPYANPVDDVVFLVRAKDREYTLFYGIVHNKYPTVYHNGACSKFNR